MFDYQRAECLIREIRAGDQVAEKGSLGGAGFDKQALQVA